MADRIVSWGGFDSKSTSGMGVTGSLSISGGPITPTSNIARGAYFNNSITSTNNSDIIIGLDINPLFSGNNSDWHTLRLWQPINEYGDKRPYISWKYGDQYDVFRMYMDANWRTIFKNTGQGSQRGFAFSGGNVEITGSTSNSLLVKGSGTTSSTTSLLVQNANASASFSVRDDGLVNIPGGGKLNFSNGSTECYITTANGTTGLGSRSLTLPGTGGPAHWLFYNDSAYGIRLQDSTGDFLTISPGSSSTTSIFTINKSAASGFGGGTFVYYQSNYNNRIYTFGNPNSERSDETGAHTKIAAGAGGSVSAQYGNGGNVYIEGGAPAFSSNIPGNILISTGITGSKVGIGTATPSASLHISGSSNSGLLQISSPTSANILYISGSGNIGIGTTSPTQLFDVNGISRFRNAVNIDNNKALAFIYSAGTSGFNLTLTSANKFQLDNANYGVNAMTFTDAPSPFVGIGTTSPSAKLHVVGSGTTSSTTALLVQNANASASLQVKDDGSIFFGTGSITYGPTSGPGAGLKISLVTSWGSAYPVSIGNLNTLDGYVVGGINQGAGGGYVLGSNNTVNSGTGYILGNNNTQNTYNGTHIMIGFGHTSDAPTNTQNASIVIGQQNNTNGYYGGGLIGSGLKYYDYGQLAFGGNSGNVNFAISQVYFGNGVRNENAGVDSNNGHGPNISINTSQAYSGSAALNRNGGSLSLRGGQGTGTGSAGDVIFATATTGSDGATYHSYSNRVWVKGHTGFVGVGTSTPSASLHVSGSSIFTNTVTISGPNAAVTMPSRPAFRVTGSGTMTNLTTTQNGDGTLNQNNWAVDYQQGSALTGSTGVFTAPLAGLYQISLVGRNSGYSSGISQLAVVKYSGASSAVQIMVEWASSSTMNHTGGSSVTYMNVGDTLKLKILAGEINFDGNDNWSVAYIG